MNISILVFLIILPLIFGIPLLLGIYVYRDANKRGMNAVLWTLIALLTPSLLGLIIYLLVRNNYSDLTCPNCNTCVEESFVVCPNCRTKLRPTCDSCGAMVQTGWAVCPHCGTDLPQFDYNVATPVKHKDKTLGKILIAVLVIPIVLFVLLFILAIPLSFNTKSGGYSIGFGSLSMEEFMTDLSEAEQDKYRLLFDEYSTSIDGTYHLFQYENSEGETYELQYIIYIPGATGTIESSADIKTKGFFRKEYYMDFELFNTEKGSEQQIFLVTYKGDIQPDYFTLTYNGKEYNNQIITYSNLPLME